MGEFLKENPRLHNGSTITKILSSQKHELQPSKVAEVIGRTSSYVSQSKKRTLNEEFLIKYAPNTKRLKFKELPEFQDWLKRYATGKSDDKSEKYYQVCSFFFFLFSFFFFLFSFFFFLFD